MRKWGFGYSSQQSCAHKLAVRCASMGWMLPESALCHSSWCGAFLSADIGLGTMRLRQPETPLIARIVITAATPPWLAGCQKVQ